MMKNLHTEKIKIANLQLDLKNFRFEEQHSQKEAIETMIADQKNKLVTLAKDIVENGLNPTDLIMVVRMPEGKNQYKVLEGNRRVTCLKLIFNQNLIPNEYASIRNQFKKLANKEVIPKELRCPLCAIFDNEDDANVWIERKHVGELEGKGTIRWNTLQKNRYEAHHGGKGTLVLQLVNYLYKMSEEDSSIRLVVNGISNTTNIERLLSDPYVREKLMLTSKKGILGSVDTTERTTSKMVKLLVALSQPDFSVNVIKSKADRKTFIDDFCSHLDDTGPTAVGKGWLLSDPSKGPTTITQQSAGEGAAENTASEGSQKRRCKLVPDHVVLDIDDVRISKVFKELKCMWLKNFPNAVAVLLRVFVELSVDCFIERNNLLPEGKLTSSSTRESLAMKIEKSVNKLEDMGKINSDFAKGILDEMNDKNSSLGIDTMNSFVHNYHFSPKAESLCTGWDNMERFLTILWQNMPSKQ